MECIHAVIWKGTYATKFGICCVVRMPTLSVLSDRSALHEWTTLRMLQFSWLLLWLKSLLHSRDLSFQSQGCCCCHRFLFRQEREAACFDRTLGCPRFPVCAVSMAPSPEVGKMRWAPKSLQSAGSFLALPVNPSQSPSHPFLLIFILYLCITGPLKNSSKGLALLNIKMYCKAAISKTMWQRFRNK